MAHARLGPAARDATLRRVGDRDACSTTVCSAPGRSAATDAARPHRGPATVGRLGHLGSGRLGHDRLGFGGRGRRRARATSAARRRPSRRPRRAGSTTGSTGGRRRARAGSRPRARRATSAGRPRRSVSAGCRPAWQPTSWPWSPWRPTSWPAWPRPAGSGGCSSRVSPSRTARRRTMSAYASLSDDEWLFTGTPST